MANEVAGSPAGSDSPTRSRSKLRLDQASFEAAQAQVGLGSWQYDPVRDIAVWSKEMFHLLRWDVALPLPQAEDFFGLFHPDDREVLRATQSPNPANGDELEARVRTNPERGPVRHLHIIVRAVRDKNGRLSHLAGTLQDETERRLAESAMEESEARYRSLFENNPAPMLIYERGTLQMLAVNDSFLRQYGYSREEALAMKLTDLYPPEEKERIAGLIPQLRGYANVGEWHHRCRDGSMLTIEVSSHDLSFDGRAARVAVINDITERKQAEEALLELNANLERRVAERTAELAVARDRAEAADRLKSAFLATMSHELRTPLNSIIGFTGIVLQGLAGPLNPEQAKQLGMVRDSARHLLSLINDVLDISKIEAGQVEISFAPFDLCASIHKVVGSVQPMADKKGLAVRFKIEPGMAEFVGDQRRIEQVLLNLLNNAVKFTERGEVTLTVERMNGAGLRLAVRDTGIGIKQGDLTTLFQPFRQIDTGLTRQHEGTGLGLAICRRLVGMMGGEIEVASEWGKGSVFTVTLPHEPTARAEPPALEARP